MFRFWQISQLHIFKALAHTIVCINFISLDKTRNVSLISPGLIDTNFRTKKCCDRGLMELLLVFYLKNDLLQGPSKKHWIGVTFHIPSWFGGGNCCDLNFENGSWKQYKTSVFLCFFLSVPHFIFICNFSCVCFK